MTTDLKLLDVDACSIHKLVELTLQALEETSLIEKEGVQKLIETIFSNPDSWFDLLMVLTTLCDGKGAWESPIGSGIHKAQITAQGLIHELDIRTPVTALQAIVKEYINGTLTQSEVEVLRTRNGASRG